MSNRGIVVVTINYRLGALGFYWGGAGSDTDANCGLWDQVRVGVPLTDRSAGGGHGSVLFLC